MEDKGRRLQESFNGRRKKRTQHEMNSYIKQAEFMWLILTLLLCDNNNNYAVYNVASIIHTCIIYNILYIVISVTVQLVQCRDIAYVVYCMCIYKTALIHVDSILHKNLIIYFLLILYIMYIDLYNYHSNSEKLIIYM